MGVVNYTTVNGEILSENRNGVKRDYVPDPLGSTIALLDNTQTKTDTFEYWPYGDVRARTGTTATPFQFVGTLGYYRDSAVRTYVRARILDSPIGRWMTTDPIGFMGGDLNLYRYAGSRVVSLTDPGGTVPLPPFYRLISWPKLCVWQFPRAIDGDKCLACCASQNDLLTARCHEGGLGKDRLSEQEYEICMGFARNTFTSCVLACQFCHLPYHDPTFDLPFKRKPVLSPTLQ